MNQEFYSSFEKIKLRFIGLLKEQTDQISKASVSIRQTPPNHSDLIVIRDIAHRIAGTAGTLGFSAQGGMVRLAEDNDTVLGVGKPEEEAPPREGFLPSIFHV